MGPKTVALTVLVTYDPHRISPTDIAQHLDEVIDESRLRDVHGIDYISTATTQSAMPQRYLVVVEGCVDPTLSQPFTSDAERLTAAREHHRNDPDGEDAVFKLDINVCDDTVIPTVECYTGGDMERDEPACNEQIAACLG